MTTIVRMIGELVQNATGIVGVDKLFGRTIAVLTRIENTNDEVRNQKYRYKAGLSVYAGRSWTQKMMIYSGGPKGGTWSSAMDKAFCSTADERHRVRGADAATQEKTASELPVAKP